MRKLFIITIISILVLTQGCSSTADRNASNTGLDNHYPLTKAENVITVNGDYGSQLAESANLQVNSAMSKAVLRRKGYFDVTPSVANKKVLVVGIHHMTSYFYIYHDLLSKGIPFDLTTYAHFVANYDSTAWRAKYDIIIIYGKLASESTNDVTPEKVKTAMQAIISNNYYKIIQLNMQGMSNGGVSESTYWLADLGLTVNSEGKPIYTTFDTASLGEQGGNDVMATNMVYKFIGQAMNVAGPTLTNLCWAADNISHVAASAEANKKWVVIGFQGEYDSANNPNNENSMIDFGKIVYYLRERTSHIALDRIYGNKFIAWGFDCDTTNNIDAINRILEVVGTRPVELGLVVQTHFKKFNRSIFPKIYL